MKYRLNTYISGSGFCSRREADKYIGDGRVTINGKRAEIGVRVFPGQKVRVNGELIVNDITPVYIAFNKPVGVVCSTNHREKDNIIDYIKHEQRIFPIGRLDKDSQGLILLTNDGDIVNKVLRAGNNHKKNYIVSVNRPITDDFVKNMMHGVPILDRVTRKCVVEKINPYTFKISLVQGLNRQIRRMCEYFGYEVLKLERVQIMHINLEKLGQGNWRDLTNDELNTLFDLVEKSEKTSPVAATTKNPKAKTENSDKFEKRNKDEKTVRTSGIKAKSETKNPKAKIKNSDKSEKRNKDEKTVRVSDIKAKSETKEKKETKVKGKKTEIVKATKADPTKKKKPSGGQRIGKQRAEKVEKNKPKDNSKRWY